MEYTAAEIVRIVTRKWQSEPFQRLRQQMDKDFDLFSLEPYKAEVNHQSYTSPAPKNDFLKILHGLNKSSLTWQIRLPEDAPENKRKSASKAEGLLTGVFDRVDRQNRKAGLPTLRAGVSWYACARGVVAVKCLLYANQDGEQEIDIQALDPYWMCWEDGHSSRAWVAYIYHVSKTEAKETWDKEIGTDEKDGVVIDWWTRKNNAVVL